VKLNTLKELYEKVKSGEIDEEKLVIVLDNDWTSFCIREPGAEDDPFGEDEDRIGVEEAHGWADIEPLYKLLFPRATVDWC